MIPRDLVWIALWVVGVAVLTQFLVAPERGLHRDDLAIVRHMTDLSTGEYRLWGDRPALWGPWRPVGLRMIAITDTLLIDHEPAVRLYQALLYALGCGLTIVLAWQVSASRTVAGATALLLVAPFPCHEVLFWQSAGGVIVPAWIAMVAAIQLTWLAARQDRRLTRVGLCLAAGALGVISTWSYDQMAVLLILLPLPLLDGRGADRSARMDAPRTLVAGASLLTVVMLAFLVQLEGLTQEAASRGGLVLDHRLLTERIPDHVSRIAWMLTSDWATLAARQLLADGAALVRGSLGLALGFGACTVGALAIGASAHAAGAASSTRRDGLTIAAGAGVFFAALVPLAIPAEQIVESRSLLLPWIGLSLATAGVTGLLRHLPGRAGPVVGGTALAVLVVHGCLSILVTLGAGDMYTRRDRADRAMVDAVRELLPDPPANAFLVPVDVDGSQTSASGVRWSPIVYSAFEVPYAERYALQLAYGRADVVALTATPYRRPAALAWQIAQPEVVTVGDAKVAWARTLFFTPRPEGVTLRHPLLVERPGREPLVLEPEPGRELVARGAAAQPLRISSDPP